MVFVGKYHLLHGTPSHALHEGALDLPDINDWIDGGADVHNDV